MASTRAGRTFLPPDPRVEEPYRLTPQMAFRFGILGAAWTAAAVMGLAVRENLGLPDAGIVNTPETRRQLTRVLRRLRPSIVIAPAQQGRHPDHRVTAELVRDACFISGLAKVEPGKLWATERATGSAERAAGCRAVVGVACEGPEGREEIEAGAVVLAGGGFESDPQMRAQYLYRLDIER